VKIELSSKELLSGTMSFLCLIFAYPINAGSQWLCQFMPDFINHLYFNILANSLLFDNNLTIFIFYIISGSIFGICLAQIVLIIIRQCTRKKKSILLTNSIRLGVNKGKVGISP
jgi:hypothetical protein